jgi:flagellar biosynthesis GTPase FlhF
VNPQTAPSSTDSDTRVYRGKSLEEVLPKVKAELGPDAVVIRRRDGLVGGVGGFFQRPFVEIEARPGVPTVDVRDEDEAMLPDFDELQDSAQHFDAPAEELDFSAQETTSFEPDLPGAFARELEKAGSEAAAWAATEPLDLAQPETALSAETAFAAPLDAEPFAAPATPFVPPTVERSPLPDAGFVPPLEAPAPLATEPPAFEPAAHHLPPAAPSGRPTSFMPSTPAAASNPLIAALSVEEPFAPEEPARLAPAPATPAARAVSGALAAGDKLREPRDQARATEAGPLEDELRDAGLSGTLARGVLAEATEHGAPFAPESDLRELTRQALARRIVAAPPSSRVIAFVGAGGAGKSLCAERMASVYAERSSLPVVHVALGTEADAAARALLPLAVPVVRAETAEEARAVIREQRDRALVVIDTPTAGDADAVATLATQLEQIGDVEVHLTLPATLSRRAAEDLLGRLEALKPARLVLTHASETAHLGPVLDVALAAGIPISYVVDADLMPAEPDRLAEGLLP